MNAQVGCYRGEYKNLTRHGHGVYHYENTFYTYKGQWKEGQKHGEGRLEMRDGSYYAGTFNCGEITGMGERYWATTGHTYKGQFCEGEMEGHGCMSYSDGSTYQGQWANNKWQGEGSLHLTDGSVYKGSFHNHKYHGEGELEASDGKYKGYWVCGAKHGYGSMSYTNGSLYQGNWKSDVYHGEGCYKHSNQFSISGLWCNGCPKLEASHLECEQGDCITINQNNVVFSIAVSCRTNEGVLIDTECGRRLQVKAGMVCTELPAEVAMRKLIYTPFEFEVEEYLITTLSEEPAGDSTSVETSDMEYVAITSSADDNTAAITSTGGTVFNNLTLPSLYVTECFSTTSSNSRKGTSEGDSRKKSIERNEKRKKRMSRMEGIKPEEILQDQRFCKPGLYVVIVGDVTDDLPSFVRRLKPLYLQVKVESAQQS